MSNLIKKLWNKNAGVKNDSQFPEGRKVPCEIVDLSTESPDKDNKDNLRVVIRMKTIDGVDKDGNTVHAGRSGRRAYDLFDRDYTSSKTGKKGTIYGEEQLVNLMKDLATLGFDTEENSFDEIQEDINNEESDSVYVYVNSKVSPSGFTNIYLSYLIPEDELPSDESDDEEDEEEEDEEEDDSDNDEESEDDDDDGEDEDDESDECELPSKGSIIEAKPAKCRKWEEYTILDVNEDKETFELSRVRDEKVYSKVDWDLARPVDA